MNFPERAVALEWVGRTLVDRDDVEIGSCTDVFLDDATELTEWVRSEVAGVPVFIPAVGAVESGGTVQVIVSRAEIAAAPPVGGASHISDEEEVALYRHYGIPYSRDASATVLPVNDVEPSAQGVASDIADPQVSVTLPAADPVAADSTAGRVVVESVAADAASAGPVAVRPVVARPVDAEPLAVLPASRTEPVLSEGQEQTSGSTPPTGGRGWVGPALAGLVAVAVAAGLVSRARRLRRQRPATPTERLADRGRSASVALSARIRPVALSVSQNLQGTRQTVRRRAGADAVSVDVPPATLEVTGLRRAFRRGAA